MYILQPCDVIDKKLHDFRQWRNSIKIIQLLVVSTSIIINYISSIFSRLIDDQNSVQHYFLLTSIKWRFYFDFQNIRFYNNILFNEGLIKGSQNFLHNQVYFCPLSLIFVFKKYKKNVVEALF